jgi:5-methylcytosine-specific restriction protein B
MITPEAVLAMLEEHTNVLLYGPPGTGKSHLMKQVENLFRKKYGGLASANAVFIDTEKEREAIGEETVLGSHSRWVTFHQGYSYEDFVIGLRPVPSSGDETGSVLSLEAKAGALLELAAYAKRTRGLMVIDEINRGNTSRIFGEFITLMEADKRLGEDGEAVETSVTVTLPYLSHGQTLEVAQGVEIERDFQMPRHIYTLASMNSVDKSTSPIDAAIRRRFYLCQLRPTDSDWETVAGVKGAVNPVASVAAEVMKKVNRGIGLYLGPDYMLGQYYLPSTPKLGAMPEDAAKRRFVGVWRHKVLPQLIEFFHARPSVCMSILEVDKHGGDSGLTSVSPVNAEADQGAASYILIDEAEKTTDAMYSFLEKFAGKAAGEAAD